MKTIFLSQGFKLFLCTVLALSGCSSKMSPPVVGAQHRDEVEIDIDQVIQKFHAKDYATTDDAMKDWISISARSPEARKRVTEKLLGIVMNCDNYRGDYRDYPLWRTAAITLGKMKSVEAIDTLSKCIDYTNFIGGLGIRRAFPAAHALQYIGGAAIPRMKEMLIDSRENSVKRHLAINVLEVIGGRDEIVLLKSVLKTEKDKSLRKRIESALDYMERSSHSLETNGRQ